MGKALKPFRKLVGERIRKLRMAAGYNQELFAKAVGVDQPHVSRWETGKQLPEGVHKATILRLLRVSEDELFGLEVKEQPSSPSIEIAKEVVNQLKASGSLQIPLGHHLVSDAEILATNNRIKDLENLIVETNLTEDELWIIRTLRTINENERRSIASMLKAIAMGSKGGRSKT